MTYAFSLLAAVFFGLNFDPATTNAATESRIYPVSPFVYRMVQPDGAAKLFTLTDADKGILAGPKPWLGVIKGKRIDIWADPKYTDDKLRTAYTFVSGRLKLMVLDGTRYTFPDALPGEGRLEELFPKRQSRQFKKNSKADIWRKDGNRLRLWFANPNSTGILFAELFILCIWLLIKTKGFLRIGIGGGAVIFSYCLIATGSRGALAGALLGLVAIAVAHVRKMFSFKTLAVVVLGLIIFGIGITVSGNAERLANTFTSIDASNSRRLKIGIAAVKMFADAPTGWRGGEVPGRNACLNWYVFDESNSLRTHFMSLAECGWFMGALYVFFWMLVLVAGAVSVRKERPLVFSLWVAFGVAGCLNPVYKDWETWLLPVMSLWAFMLQSGRLTHKEWKKVFVVSALLALTAVSGLVVIGKSMKRPTKISVRCSGNATIVNGENPHVWVVGDPLVMGGVGFPGREILAFCLRNPNVGAIAYVYDVKDLPSKAETVIVAGRNVPDFLDAYKKGRSCKASKLFFLSASVGPNAVPEQLVKESNLRWIAGSLLADRNKLYADKGDWVKLVAGCERYIPDWTKLLLQ